MPEPMDVDRIFSFSPLPGQSLTLYDAGDAIAVNTRGCVANMPLDEVKDLHRQLGLWLEETAVLTHLETPQDSVPPTTDTATSLELAADADEDIEWTCFTDEQQQRQEALWSAGSALRSERAGGLFSKGSSSSPGDANGLIAVAHFITSGGRDYIPSGNPDRVYALGTQEVDHD